MRLMVLRRLLRNEFANTKFKEPDQLVRFSRFCLWMSGGPIREVVGPPPRVLSEMKFVGSIRSSQVWLVEVGIRDRLPTLKRLAADAMEGQDSTGIQEIEDLRDDLGWHGKLVVVNSMACVSRSAFICRNIATVEDIIDWWGYSPCECASDIRMIADGCMNIHDLYDADARGYEVGVDAILMPNFVAKFVRKFGYIHPYHTDLLVTWGQPDYVEVDAEKRWLNFFDADYFDGEVEVHTSRFRGTYDADEEDISEAHRIMADPFPGWE
jgi:hypothetical protein